MNNQLSFIDIVSLASYFIAIENLDENRQQSAANDVNKANDDQAKYLLAEIGARLDKQDAMLTHILEVLNESNKDPG